MNTDSHRSGLQPDGSYILDDSILSTDQYSLPNPKRQNQEQMKPDYKFLDRLPSLSKVELLVLKGLISGDGDIGGRMASSHADAKPPVNAQRKEFLQKIADDYAASGMSMDAIDDLLKS